MAPQMPTRVLGKQGLQASAQGLGCMSLSTGRQEELGPERDRIAVIQKALSSGITLLNTADMYGPYANHILIGMINSDCSLWLKPCACLCTKFRASVTSVSLAFLFCQSQSAGLRVITLANVTISKYFGCRQSHQGHP